MSPRTGRPTDNPREKRIGIRVSEEEIEMISYCLKNSDMSQSDIIRLGVRKVYEEIKNQNN